MINEIPYYLTNRTNGFLTPFIRENTFVPVTGDHMLFRAAEELRNLLKLDKVSTDWYWRPLHAAILADKMFCSWFDTASTISPGTCTINSPVFYNSKVSGISNRPNLVWLPGSLPDSFLFEFTLNDDFSATYVNGSKRGNVLVEISNSVQVNPDLTILLPNCDFGFITTLPPEPGVNFGVLIEPSHYPVKETIALCEASPSHNLLLAGYGLLPMYSAIPDDLFKLGMIAGLIARATKEYGR